MSPASLIRIGEERDGGEVDLAPGDILEVSLRGNPSTGYGWEVVHLPRVLGRSEGPGFVSDSPARIGSGGTVTTTFLAKRPGAGRLRMVYRRRWEDLPPKSTYQLRVVVH